MRARARLLAGLALATLLAVAGAALVAYRNLAAGAPDFEALQSASGDGFIASPLGRTRYRVHGRETDPVVVLVHGFNGFLESWDPNVDAMAAAGYRVVAYDLWGRGLSSRPDVDLRLDVFRAQLETVVDAFTDGDVVLVGASFGCVVAADYALHHRARVAKLAFVGPAGWPSGNPLANAAVRVPVLGEIAFGLAGERILRGHVDAYFIGSEGRWAIDYWERYARMPGHLRAALSTLRHAPVLDYTDGWRQLVELDTPILFVWGKQDVSFPYAHAATAQALLPRARIVGIDDAAHWVNVEKVDVVNAELVRFLDGTNR